MKKYMLGVFSLLMVLGVNSQNKEGKIVYERTVQMQVSFAGMTPEMERMIPKSRTDKFELEFGNNQSVWKQAPPDNESDNNSFSGAGEGGGTFQIRVSGGGAMDDVLYSNFDTRVKVEKKEVFEKVFIIDDSLLTLKWKIDGETKKILDHPCMKATSTRIATRMQTRMENGKMERKEVTDTSVVVAWFATDMPVSAGPADFQGQLPGVILELDLNNGKLIYKALSISEKADIASIKAPTGKKRYTPAEFKKENDKMMEQMRQNNGGERRIIMN